MDQSFESIFANLVRVGTVSSIDPDKKRARVIYRDMDDMVSGWLCVIQRNGAGVSVSPDGEHTHTITVTEGGGSASTVSNHNHPGSAVTSWMPKVNDTVLAIYLPVFDSDGFILGVI